MTDSSSKALDEIALLGKFTLEELFDVHALEELVRSAEQLFDVAIRLYSSTGTRLVDTGLPPELYVALQKSKQGRGAVNDVVGKVLRSHPARGEVLHVSCISGGYYVIASVSYESTVLGRLVLGPVLDQETLQVPNALLAFDGVTESELASSWSKLPHKSAHEVERIQKHLEKSFDVLVWSGLRAHLASNMHLASVRESFRELTDNNVKLQAAYERLKELDRLKSNFLATVSHELRTPLTSIIGFSEMLLEGIPGEINEEQREFVMTIHDKGVQLLDLIKTLLDLSKLESGTMSLRKRLMDCGELARDVAQTLTPTARKRNVVLSAVVDKDLPEYLGDAERLRQVLLNLTDNAIKFTPIGGKVVIHARLGEDLGEVHGPVGAVLGSPSRRAIEISVTDTGVGVPPEQRDRVFDAFYQVDNSATREVGGTGLGLSIVKRLVEAHDGTVTIEQNEPQGSIFRVHLPLKRPGVS